MICVTAIYQPTPNFNLDYYLNTHTPLVEKLFTPHGLKKIQVLKGVGGLFPGSPADFGIVATLHFESLEGLQAALSAAGPEILGDIGNFTDIPPKVQVNEVLV